MDPVETTPTEPVDYAAISAAYGALLAGLVAATRGQEQLDWEEVLPLGLATFALSKTLTKEKVETWLREPFVAESAEGERRPKGRRLRYAVGELLTCSRCMGAWSALGLVGLRATRPREGRLVMALLGATALNDFLQTAFTWACARCNLAERSCAAVEEEEPAPASVSPLRAPGG